MELNKEHRSALLQALTKAKQDMEQAKKLLNYEVEDNAVICGYTEIDDYLAQQRIASIEKALIENEIDY